MEGPFSERPCSKRMFNIYNKNTKDPTQLENLLELFCNLFAFNKT